MEGSRVVTVGRSTYEREEDKGAEYPARIRVRKMMGNLKRGRKRRASWCRAGGEGVPAQWGGAIQ